MVVEPLYVFVSVICHQTGILFFCENLIFQFNHFGKFLLVTRPNILLRHNDSMHAHEDLARSKAQFYMNSFCQIH